MFSMWSPSFFGNKNRQLGPPSSLFRRDFNQMLRPAGSNFLPPKEGSYSLRLQRGADGAYPPVLYPR